jgi:hypothetical protein
LTDELAIQIMNYTILVLYVAVILVLPILLRMHSSPLKIWEKISITIGIIISILVYLTFLFRVQYELPIWIRIILSLTGIVAIVIVILFHYKAIIKQKLKGCMLVLQLIRR